MSYSVLSKYRTELMGAAILWVMLFHAYDLDMGWPVLEWLRAAGFGGVDIFILLSTMGLVMSLSRRGQEYGAFLARRVSRILPAYYAVMVPYTVFQMAYRQAPLSALIWNSLLLYYWVRPKGAFNWYVAGAMTFYLITPPCFRRMQASRRREWLAAAGILGGLALCRIFLHDGYWGVVDIAYRVPVFFLGLLIGFYAAEGRRLKTGDILFWCGWLGLGVCYLLATHLDQGVVFLPMCHLFLFTTVPMCLVVCWCFEHLPLGGLRRGLRVLGTHSLEIYLLNVSWFNEVELLRRFVSFGPDNRLYYLLSFAVNIALAWVLHRAVEGLREKWQRHTEKNRETA